MAAASEIKSGDEFFREGKYLKAAGMYMKAMKKEPENAEVRCNLSYAFLKECKFVKALEAADASLAIDDSSDKAHFRRGLALAALERWDECVDALVATQKRQPASTNSEVPDMLKMAMWRCKSAHQEAGTEVPEFCKNAKRPAKVEEPKEEEVAVELTREQKLEKLAAVRGAQQQRRMSKHTKETMQKKDAAAIADRELVTKQMLQQAKDSLEADERARVRAEDLTTDKIFEEKRKGMKDGEKLEYNADRVARFAKTELKGLSDAGDRAAFKEPIAIVLPGVCRDGWGDEGQGVSMGGAFNTELQHGNACKFLSKYLEDTGAHAVMMVAHKSKVIHPKLDSLGGPSADGFFVQLVARVATTETSAWFVEVGTEGAQATVHELPKGGLIPDVFNIQSTPTQKPARSKAAGKKAARKAKQAMAVIN